MSERVSECWRVPMRQLLLAGILGNLGVLTVVPSIISIYRVDGY